MNISKLLVSCFLATAWVFAQDLAPAAQAPALAAPIQFQTPPAESYQGAAAYATSPQPQSSGPEVKPPPEGKTIFDNVRGNAYNPYGTVGAASTVRDLVEKPADIFGNQFFYISPVRSARTNISGYTALPFGGNSVLLGLDHDPTENLASWILGYANSSFGIALDYSVSKLFTSNKTIKTSTRTTYPGDNIGVYFSSGELYANANWLTYGQSSSTDVDGNSSSEDYSQIEGTVGLSGKSGSFNYDAYVNGIRTGGTRKDKDDNKSVDQHTFLGGSLNFDIGYTAFQSSNARVIAGSNNRIVAKFFDGVQNGRKADQQFGLVIAPNILGEFGLTENWLTFAGASNDINVLAGDGQGNSSTSRLGIAHADGTDAYVGIRYQKANLALEAEVAANVFNNPVGGFAGSNMFVGFGGFVYF